MQKFKASQIRMGFLLVFDATVEALCGLDLTVLHEERTRKANETRKQGHEKVGICCIVA